MSDNSLIYVDLIEDEPKTLEQWAAEHPGWDVDDLRSAHRKYLDDFQPWRLLVKSGGNQKPLFRSTERYFNEADARHAADIAFGDRSNVYLRQAEHGDVTLRLAVPQ